MTIEKKTEKESRMENVYSTDQITDIKLAHIYLTIKKHGTITINLLEDSLDLEMSAKSVEIGLRELREKGCITNKRKTVGMNRHLAIYSITAHNCDYCTPHIKYERTDHGSIFLPPVVDL